MRKEQAYEMEIKKNEREKRKGSGKRRETSDGEREEEEVKHERSSRDGGTEGARGVKWRAARHGGQQEHKEKEKEGVE